MIKTKFIKWGYIAVASLVLGLSSCAMERQNAQNGEYSSQYPNAKAQVHAEGKQVKQKTYASKEPTQKSTPGPKHTAAPQLPVIQ